MRSHYFRDSLLLFVLGVSLQAPVLADTKPLVADLLDIEASNNARATQGLLLAMARAGARLVAVGERGTVLLSDDSGKNWRQAKLVPVSVALTGVTFTNGELGWAIGHSGVVIHSEDGGETWSRQIDGRKIGSLVINDAKAMIANGKDASRYLKDAEALLADGPDKPFLGIYFADALHGWVVGAYGLALETTDGGRNWKSIMGRVPNAGGRHLYAVAPTTDGLIIAGEQGNLFRSTDGGVSFSAIKTPYSGTFFGVAELGNGSLVAYGLRGNAWRKSSDGLWKRIDLAQAETLTCAITLADGGLILADEGGRLFRGSSEGSSFTSLKHSPLVGMTSMVQSPDGSLVMAGLRGARRQDIPSTVAELNK